MSRLLPTPEELEQWARFLENKFIAASQSEEAYLDGARVAYRGAVKWFHDDSQVVGGFRWVCDLLNLEPVAVRRAAREKDADRLRALL